MVGRGCPRRDGRLRGSRRPGRRNDDVGGEVQHCEGREHCNVDRLEQRNERRTLGLSSITARQRSPTTSPRRHSSNASSSGSVGWIADDRVGRVVTGALVPNTTLWYTARGTGFVVGHPADAERRARASSRWCAGARRAGRGSSPPALHKNISLLSVVFLGVHIATTLFDPVSPVHLLNAIVPFTGRYRPLGIGLGVVAIDLLAALVVTSLLRAAHRLPRLARGALERVRVLADRDVARPERRAPTRRRRGRGRCTSRCAALVFGRTGVARDRVGAERRSRHVRRRRRELSGSRAMTAAAEAPRTRAAVANRLLPRLPAHRLVDHLARLGSPPRPGRELIGEVERAGLRGRGGAGLPDRDQDGSGAGPGRATAPGPRRRSSSRTAPRANRSAPRTRRCSCTRRTSCSTAWSPPRGPSAPTRPSCVSSGTRHR